MKSFYLLLISFTLSSFVALAQEIDIIPMPGNQSETTVPNRTPIPVQAYLANSSIEVVFIQSFGQVRVSILDQSMGVVIEVFFDSGNGICYLQSPAVAGYYVLQIQFETGESYYGFFERE